MKKFKYLNLDSSEKKNALIKSALEKDGKDFRLVI